MIDLTHVTRLTVPWHPKDKQTTLPNEDWTSVVSFANIILKEVKRAPDSRLQATALWHRGEALKKLGQVRRGTQDVKAAKALLPEVDSLA